MLVDMNPVAQCMVVSLLDFLLISPFFKCSEQLRATDVESEVICRR